MVTFILMFKNVWTIVSNFPRILALLAPIIRIIGSEEFRKMLETIYSACVGAWNQIRQEVPETPAIPKTDEQRTGIVKRIRKRLGLSFLKMKETEYDNYCHIIGKDDSDLTA